MPANYALRPCTDDDYSLLREIYFSTRQAEMDRVPWPPAEKFKFLQQQFDAQDQHYREQMQGCEFMIIEIDGRAAGRLYLDRRSDEIRIVDIALLPTERGRGLGGEIMTDILEEARDAGLPVRIHVEMENPAMHLYERLGFESVRTDGIYYLMEKHA